MFCNQVCCGLLRLFGRIPRYRSRIWINIRASFATFSESPPNYYDILDKRNLTESPGFDKNDSRKTWTNRDEITTEDYFEEFEYPKHVQRSVTVYRICKVTNHRSKVDLPINSLEGDELVSGICYNFLGIENDITLEYLYEFFRTKSLEKNKGINLSGEKLDLLKDFQTQVERLLYRRALNMENSVKVLILFDRLSFLSHELRNFIQSHMLLNIHRFTPFQIIATFEVFSKHKERYEGFLNVLCLIFYDHMIPFVNPNIPTPRESKVEICHILNFIQVLKDFSFKKLTDVLYAHVYDNLDLLSTEDMVQVCNTFFKNKKDPNFVELYTKMLSSIFQIPLMDLYEFEEYAKRCLKETEVSGVDTFSFSKPKLLEDINFLKSIFNCNSEFLLSSVHHRIEFKRLWRYNIKTNNVSWKVPSTGGETSEKVDMVDEFTSSSPKEPISYSVNFPELYEKIENAILKGFKFKNQTPEFVSNLIAIVLDYSRYSSSSNTMNILASLYALLPNLYGDLRDMVSNLVLISPKTLLSNSHVYFYKIDPKCEFYRDSKVNYYKPHLTLYSLFQGDYSLYSLLIGVFESCIEGFKSLTSKEDILKVCKLLRNIVHPFYCCLKVSNSPFLVLDLLHMTGNLNDKSHLDMSIFISSCQETIRKSMENGLSKDLGDFTEKARNFALKIFSEELGMNEKVEILKTVSTLKVCNPEMSQNSVDDDYLESTVSELLQYFRTPDKEDLEDGVRVGKDLRLLDYISDVFLLGSYDKIYELLNEILKVVYSRIHYYSVPELVQLSGSLCSLLNHFGSLDLESDELLENIGQRLSMLKEEDCRLFESKSRSEEDFDPETKKTFNILTKYHLL